MGRTALTRSNLQSKKFSGLNQPSVKNRKEVALRVIDGNRTPAFVGGGSLGWPVLAGVRHQGGKG